VVMAAGQGPAEPKPGLFSRLRARVLVRAEDLVLAGWIGLADPALAHAQGTAGPFDGGQPVEGLLRLAGVAGALACLATRSTDRPNSASILEGGLAGPVVGGLMLVGAGAFAGLGLDPEPGMVLALVAAMVGAGLRSHLPALSPAVRRTLITPFALAAGGIFWSFVEGFTGGAGLSMDPATLVSTLSSSEAQFVLTMLTAAAAVYYAMLIFAPRQIAEREGGPIEWLFRFALFMASVVFGLGWLSLLGG
jgi:hypothetical protein